MSLALTSLFVISCFATSTKIEKRSSSILDERVIALIESYDKNLKISKSSPLYDSSDNIVAWCYSLSPKGYVIINSDNYIVEFSFKNNFEFKFNQKIYYTGPLNYFKRDNNSYVDLKTSKKIEKN
ncbi:MAG: hypothetical protein RSC30_01460 [Oscillospiraceae bacterium]